MKATTGARAGGKTGASTRDRLIDAAFRVVARDGLEAASVKAIAAEAQVAPGLMHYHFPTKEAVIAAALERSVADYRARGESRRSDLPPDAQLPAFLREARDGIEGERDFFKVRLACAARAMTHAPTAEMLAAQTGAAVEETATVLAAARGGGIAERDRVLAFLLKAAFDGVMLNAIANPSFPVEEVADLLERLVPTLAAD